MEADGPDLEAFWTVAQSFWIQPLESNNLSYRIGLECCFRGWEKQAAAMLKDSDNLRANVKVI